MKPWKRTVLLTAALLVTFSTFAPFALAQQQEGENFGAADEVTPVQREMGAGYGLRELGIAIGAGFAIFGGAIGTGFAQANIGASGAAAIAEKPELFGRIFILVVLPETVVVFGFVIALMLYAKI